MQTFRSFTMSVAFVAMLLPQSTFAQGTITTFEAEGQTLHSSSYIPITGSFGNERHPLPNSTMSGQLDLNDADTTVTFRRVEIDIEDLELSGEFLQGFGSIVTIEGTIDFDPIVFTDNRALALGAGQDNQFPIANFENRFVVGQDVNVSGSYEFSGPTESVEGTFDSGNLNFGHYGSAGIDMVDYPNSVTIEENPYWIVGSTNLPFITETIDGIAISFGSEQHWFYAPDDFEFTPQIIPEPSEYALMIGGLLIAFVAIRRMSYKT